MRKKSTSSKFQVFGVSFKSARPVYYQLHLNLIQNSLKTFFFKKAHFCIFLLENRGLRDNFSERLLNFCPLHCTY